MRNALTLFLFVMMICGCGIKSQRYLRSYIDVEQEGKCLLGKLKPADTALLYLKLCSGCIRGTRESGYLFRKSGTATIARGFFNYGKSPAQKIDIPWDYILANQKFIPGEETRLRGVRTEIIDGDTIQILPETQSHGPVYRLVLQMGSEKVAYFFNPGERPSADGLYRSAFMDSLDARLEPVRWRLTQKRLKPRWYKSDNNHLRSVDWDNRHSQ